jgi:hypothetical protein
VLGRLNEGNFIHLGGDVSVYCSDLLGIFDIERTTVNPSVNRFLAAAQKRGEVYYCSLDIESMPKSFAVTTASESTVFVTNVSTGTIKKRAII